MGKMEELLSLQQKVILFSVETVREKRWKAGLWAENEARRIDEQYRILDGFDKDAKVELGAIIKIIFDYLLYDKLEDEDWIDALPDHYDGDLDAVVEEMRRAPR